MDELSVEELLLIISEKESDESEAHKAFTILYRRFSEFLLSAVNRQLASKGIYNKELAEDTVTNTFYEVYLNPLSFKFDTDTHNSEERAFKAWLSVIARNEWADIVRAAIKTASMNVLTDNGELNDTFVELVLSKNRKLLDNALAGLTDRERDILLTCYDYHEEDKYTPSEVLDALCEIWGTTRPNVRQLKKRALDKVKAYINSPINTQKLTP
jgi:RNA polymerase sigma factor (sigma-70 family)